MQSKSRSFWKWWKDWKEQGRLPLPINRLIDGICLSWEFFQLLSRNQKPPQLALFSKLRQDQLTGVN